MTTLSSCWKYVYDHQHVLPPVCRNFSGIFEVFYCSCHFWPNLNFGCRIISQTARALVWPQRSTKRATSCNKSISSLWHKQKRVHLVLIMAVTQNIGCNTPASHLLQSCLVRSVCILHFVSMGSLQQSLNQTFKYSQHLSRAPSLFKLPMFIKYNIYIYIYYIYIQYITVLYSNTTKIFTINIDQIST